MGRNGEDGTPRVEPLGRGGGGYVSLSMTNDEPKRKSSLSLPLSLICLKTGLCFSVNEVESLANTLNQLLREICSELEIEGSVMHEKC